MLLLRGFSLLLCWLCITLVSIPADAHQPGAPAAEVRLEPHDGKTVFYLGEPIQLDLVFENHTGSAFSLNASIYGDLSEKVEITPATGWFQWQTQSGHDYASIQNLGDQPIRIPVRLNEGFVFREPGHYRVRVTTARVHSGSALGGPYLPEVTTNEVELELKTMPADVESGILRGIRAELASEPKTCPCAESESAENAMARLAALQGDQSLAEKIRLLDEGDDGFRHVYREAFASTRDLKRQLALLEDAWTNPALIPRFDTPDALDETRSLIAGRSLEGWRMVGTAHPPDPALQKMIDEHHDDMAALLDSMPRRSGESRTMGAYFLIDFNGLTEAEHARAVDYAVEEFPHMDSGAKDTLLSSTRPPLRDARLTRMITSILTENPADHFALAALIAIAPEEATPWVAKAICNSGAIVLLDTYKDLHTDRIPATDACLAAQLGVAPATPRAEFEWKQHAEAAARFATRSIVPALKEGWQKPSQDGGALAILLRDAPVEAVKLLNKELAAGRFNGQLFYESRRVFSQLAQPFPGEATAWLRERLAEGSDQEAGFAAYALSIGGETSDATLIEERLQRLRSAWSGREHEVATSKPGDSAYEARKAENELSSTLSYYESRTKVDAERRHELAPGCMSDECRLSLR